MACEHYRYLLKGYVMTSIKSFAALTCLSSLIFASINAFASDNQFIDDTPFLSGQTLKKGFNWYDDPVKKEAPESSEQLQPQTKTERKAERVELNSEWLKKNIPSLLRSAMDNPTPENLSKYYTAQRLMLDISTRFADKSKDYFQKNPLMSEKRRQPVEKIALDAHRAVVEKAQQDVVAKIFEKSGLWFFFQSTCQFCHEESQILSYMQNYYKADIMPISVDGLPLRNGLFRDFAIPTPDIMEQYKIHEVPTIYLVSNDGKSAQRISEGMISAEELKNTIIAAARGLSIIDDADFQSTLDIKRQYTIGDDGVLTVDKQQFERDPFLLQKTMEQQIEQYGMPTTDPINYINASTMSAGAGVNNE